MTRSDRRGRRYLDVPILASGDGQTNDSHPIQRAIDACAQERLWDDYLKAELRGPTIQAVGCV